MEPKTSLTNTLNIRLVDSDKRALEIIANTYKVSVSEVARNAIRREVQRFALIETSKAEQSLIEARQ